MERSPPAAQLLLAQQLPVSDHNYTRGRRRQQQQQWQAVLGQQRKHKQLLAPLLSCWRQPCE
jgi:hypothetical protein